MLPSRQFGFLKLNSPEQTKKKALVVRAVKYLERMLVQAQAEKQRRKADSMKASAEETKDEDEDKGISIDPKTYCKLGHFHLLLEDYNKGEIPTVIFHKRCFSLSYFLNDTVETRREMKQSLIIVSYYFLFFYCITLIQIFTKYFNIFLSQQCQHTRNSIP